MAPKRIRRFWDRVIHPWSFVGARRKKSAETEMGYTEARDWLVRAAAQGGLSNPRRLLTELHDKKMGGKIPHQDTEVWKIIYEARRRILADPSLSGGEKEIAVTRHRERLIEALQRNDVATVKGLVVMEHKRIIQKIKELEYRTEKG